MAVRVFEFTEFRSVGLRAIELSEGSGITAVSACGIRPHSSVRLYITETSIWVSFDQSEKVHDRLAPRREFMLVG
jgi:hypothetical protein